MRIGIVVHDLRRLQAGQSTVRLGQAVVARGHEAWWLGLGDLEVGGAPALAARARRTREGRGSAAAFLERVRGPRSVVEKIDVASLDVLLVRVSPGKVKGHPWLLAAGLEFARQAEDAGVLVLNSPQGLARSVSKLYLERFPSSIRPRGLVTRDPARIRAFAAQIGAPVVLKPMTGTGGARVFLLRPDDTANLGPIVEVLGEGEYVVCQEYLGDAVHGDTRLLLLEGAPIEVAGRVCAVRRVPREGELRSNVAAGGVTAAAVATDHLADIAAAVRPRLVEDGVFLAGLDVIGGLVVEINAWSPGGIEEAGAWQGVDFFRPVVDAIEARRRATG